MRHGLPQSVFRLFGETGDADVTDVPFRPPADGLHRDDRPGDRHVEGIRVFPLNGQADVRAGIATHLLDRIEDRDAVDRFAVEMGDQIAGLQSRPVGRRALDGRDDPDIAVLHGDLDSQAAELAAGGNEGLLQFLGVQVGRMRIERRDHGIQRRLDDLLGGEGSRFALELLHPLEGGIDQYGVVDGTKIVAADPEKGILEMLQLLGVRRIHGIGAKRLFEAPDFLFRLVVQGIGSIPQRSHRSPQGGVLQDAALEDGRQDDPRHNT